MLPIAIVKQSRLLLITCILGCLSGGTIFGQLVTPPVFVVPPQYTPLVYDIDWTYLKDPEVQRDWTDQLHYLQLGTPEQFLSITGQIRQRGEYQDYPAWGSQPPENGYLLQRYLLSGDIHLGDHFRTFIQLDSGLISDRDGGPRPGIDRDRLDFNQAFLDLMFANRRKSNMTVRLGRQLVSLGSTRLVATGAGLNVEQPFDGVRVTVRTAGWTADLLALRPTLIQTGLVDNKPNSSEALWGLYTTHSLPGLKSGNFDIYYLGFDHKSTRYTQGVGREQRETLGARVWSHTSTWDYDFEYTGQFGRFANGNIRAWGTGYHLAYTFSDRRFSPRPELDGGFLSGDGNRHDKTLGTFNPLFPNGNYLSESILLGPYNLIITRPTIKMALSKKASVNTNAEFLWREAVSDGVYNIVGILIHPAAGSNARYIGSQIQEELSYVFSRHLTGTLAYEHFFSGAFLKQSPPGHSLNFVSPQLTWNF